jgi:hypothetical protein
LAINLFERPAFDATEPQVFTFSSTGSQAFKNRLTVRDNLTNAVVYNDIIETFQLRHELPANKLTNGVLYNAVITTFDINNVESAPSNTIIFYCYSTPSFMFSNLTENQIIQNSSYEVNLTYSQPQGEILNSWQVLLYDEHKQLLNTSGLRYKTDILSYVVSGLEDNDSYYIRATGETLNRMEICSQWLNWRIIVRMGVLRLVLISFQS